MNNKVKIIIGLIVVAIGSYLIGMLFPIKNILPLVSKNTEVISCYERWILIINFFLALFTLLAVFVALLKEEIVALWRKPALFIVQNLNNSLLSEHLQDNANNSILAADSYDVLITLKNKGKIDAKNIKIQISEAIFINHQTNNKCLIPIKNKTIKIEENQCLSRHSSIDIKLASLFNKQEPQDKQGTGNMHEIIYLIGSNEIDTEYHNGEIQLAVIISCEGGYILRRKFSLKWDKKWGNRLVDISPRHLTATMLKEVD